MASGHLRRDLKSILMTGLAIECVEYHVAVIASHVGSGPDRIEDREIRLRYEFQYPFAFCARKRRQCQGRSRARQECTSPHNPTLHAPKWLTAICVHSAGFLRSPLRTSRPLETLIGRDNLGHPPFRSATSHTQSD